MSVVTHISDVCCVYREISLVCELQDGVELVQSVSCGHCTSQLYRDLIVQLCIFSCALTLLVEQLEGRRRSILPQHPPKVLVCETQPDLQWLWKWPSKTKPNVVD